MNCDKEWDDFLGGYSEYGDESPRYGLVNEVHKTIRVSPNVVKIEGAASVRGQENLLDFYFGKGGKK